jgi:hypothetical protein
MGRKALDVRGANSVRGKDWESVFVHEVTDCGFRKCPEARFPIHHFGEAKRLRSDRHDGAAEQDGDANRFGGGLEPEGEEVAYGVAVWDPVSPAELQGLNR